MANRERRTRYDERRMTAKDVLLRLLDEAYDKKAWHGTNLRGALRGLTADVASWRPAEKRHNIWELAMHCAYWKYTIARKLRGDKRGSFPRKGSNWFTIDAGSDDVWRADLKLLEEQHRLLRDAVLELRDKDLPMKKASRYDIAGLIYGVASHDLYHTGQIQILKRLYKEDGRER
jgi:hypothetical protein